VPEVVRFYIWSLGDSKTTLDEVREHVPPAAAPDFWISNDAAERFGLVTFGETDVDDLERVRNLIGKEPDVAEEFDVG
jgi:hypothetical protein